MAGKTGSGPHDAAALTDAFENRVEELLEKPFMIIDMLPVQVPENSRGQYFAVEEYYRRSGRIVRIKERYIDLLLAINAYEDLWVMAESVGQPVKNPSPDSLAEWVKSEKHLSTLADGGKTLLTMDADDTYATVYQPGRAFLKLLNKLAGANGLFVWQPPKE